MHGSSEDTIFPRAQSLFLYHDDVPGRGRGGATTTASEGPFTFSNLSLADDIAILINLSRQSTRSLALPLPPFTPDAPPRAAARAHHSRVSSVEIRSGAGEKFRRFQGIFENLLNTLSSLEERTIYIKFLIRGNRPPFDSLLSNNSETNYPICLRFLLSKIYIAYLFNGRSS